MMPVLLVVALDYRRAPLRYPQLADPRRPLPAAFEALLAELGVALVPDHLARCARQLRRDPRDLEEAVRFFVRYVLLSPDADHYRVLGLSQTARPDAIRRHYYLLARLFHPDRTPPSPDGSTSEMSRLNKAHWTLRDPERKRRYDADLAAQGRSDAEPLPMAAFRPGPGLTALLPGPGARHRLNRRSAALGTLLLGTSVAFVAWLFWPSRETGIRMNLDRAALSVPGPAYLVGDRRQSLDLTLAPGMERDPAPTSAPAAVDAPRGRDDNLVPRPPLVIAAVAETPPSPSPEAVRDQTVDRPVSADLAAATPASAAPSPPPVREPQPRAAVSPPRPDPVPEGPAERPATATPREPLQSVPEPPTPAISRAPRPEANQAPRPAERSPRVDVVTQPAAVRANERDRVVARFVSTYRRGDLNGFVSLFAPHAEVNEGRGHALIRSVYADFFRRVPERRLEIDELQWRSGDPERVIGEARVSVGIRSGGAGQWRHGRGGIRFELVWNGDAYRIARMLHDVESL